MEHDMKWFLLFGLFFITLDLSAQQSFVVTGDDIKTGYGSVHHSVGQLIITSDSTLRGSIMHGVQLPIELFRNPVGVEEFEDIKAEAYPNPTFDHVKISIPEQYIGPFTISVISANGSMIETHTINANELLISLANQPAGMYMIRIAQDSKTVSSYSIIKH